MSKIKKPIVAIAIISAFVVGGFTFNAITSDAFGNNMGHWTKGDFDWKEMKEKMAGKFGHFGKIRMWQYSDEVNYEIINIDNGIQVTITSDDPDIIQKLQEYAARMQEYLNK